MQIICPKCQFTRNIDPSKLPANTSHATCPKCAEKFSIVSEKESIEQKYNRDNVFEQEELETVEERRQRAHSIYKEEAQRASEDNANEHNFDKEQENAHSTHEQENIQYFTMVPWEILGNELSLYNKFYLTIKRVLTAAPLFFATMLKTYPMQRALIFYIIIGMIQFIAKMLAFQLSSTELLTDNAELQALYDVLTSPTTFFIGIVISPFVLLLQAHIVSLLLLFTIKLVQPQSANYPLIVRIVSYSSAAGIVSIVPIIGDYIAIPWMVFNFLLACRYSLQMSMVKASLTVLAFTLFSLGLLLFILPVF